MHQVRDSRLLSGCQTGGRLWRRQEALLILSNGSELEEKALLPMEYDLKQNFPNPFNPSTTIRYQAPERSFVELSIFNIKGEIVNQLRNEAKNPGYYVVKWNGKDIRGIQMPTGIYSCRMKSKNFVENMRMLLIR